MATLHQHPSEVFYTCFQDNRMAFPMPILYSYGEPVGIYSPNYENFGMTFYEMMEETVQAGNITFAHELPDLYPMDNPESQLESYG